MATDSSVLAWRIPGTGEPGGLLSMESHRVGHDWSDLAAVAAEGVIFPNAFFNTDSKSLGAETEFSTSSMKLFFQLLCYHCQTTPSKISTTSVDLFSPLPLKKPAAAAAKSLQSCPTLCNPIDGSPPGSLVLGFSRQEHWSGLPFPSPMHESEKWKWCHSVVSDPQRCHGLQPSRLLRPWDFPGKSTGVGCH